MGLKQLRLMRNMTQKALAQMSGINIRSLQDYEQGHKSLSSANGEVLLRFTTVLGCTLTDLLISEDVKGASMHFDNKVDVATIQNQRFYSERYKTAGRWVCGDGTIATVFYYNGQQYILPFHAYFTPVLLPCLREAAILQMEEKIENIMFLENGFEEW